MRTDLLRDQTELRRLVLKLERDLMVRSHLKTLLVAADCAIAGLRRDLQSVKQRVARRGRA